MCYDLDMSDEQFTSFVRSLNEDEAVEWDLLLSNGVKPQRAYELISSARPPQAPESGHPTTGEIFADAYREIETQIFWVHSSLARLFDWGG